MDTDATKCEYADLRQKALSICDRAIAQGRQLTPTCVAPAGTLPLIVFCMFSLIAVSAAIDVGSWYQSKRSRHWAHSCTGGVPLRGPSDARTRRLAGAFRPSTAERAGGIHPAPDPD